jgi:GTP-binding protein Era
MNRLVGTVVSIMSHKPQTTRNMILGILTKDTAQFVFIDTPGIHRPKTSLGKMMNKEAAAASADADVDICMVSAPDGLTELDIEIILHKRTQKNAKELSFLVINKADAVQKTDILGITEKANGIFKFTETVPISAKRGDNVDVLLSLLEEYLPSGPRYFPGDIVTDMPERLMWAEFVRGKALLYLQDEVPHGVAVEIIKAGKRESRDLIDIDAVIYCEKDTHKGIIIGKGGEMLKKIGAGARNDLERLTGMAVNLGLWVKVKKDWRDNAALARSFANLEK